LQNEPKLDRNIYESALQRMEKMGSRALMHPHLIQRRDVIKTSLLIYYESTEEYEKCKYVTDFFSKLEKDLLIESIVKSVEQKNLES
jgi:hypothetical protein